MERWEETSPTGSRLKRWGLLAAGWSAVALGTVGVFLPVLPTTPFLLLAALCFSRSSERVHRWFVGHRYFGSFVAGYLGGCGIPLRAKLSAIGLVWLTISGSALYLGSTPISLLLLLTAVGTTAYLLRQPTCSAKPADPGVD